MRRARITFEGAIHHAMNRSYNGLPIFQQNEEKKLLLELIHKNRVICKVSVLAYCLMDNHYHFIIQNSSGRMSEFFKRLNGEFGSIYRKRYGGRGYVFQDRYKSILIQDDSYLLLAIAYVLNNPVRVGIVRDFTKYKWSSSSIYFSDGENKIIDKSFIEDQFSNKQEFESFIKRNEIEELPTIKTETGSIIGGDSFYFEALKKFNRRKKETGFDGKRSDDFYFDPVEKIFFEFEKKHNLNLDELDTSTFKGKRIRGELLVHLKDRGGLTYREIKKLDVFAEVKFNSLGRIYKYAKQRIGNQ